MYEICMKQTATFQAVASESYYIASDVICHLKSVILPFQGCHSFISQNNDFPFERVVSADQSIDPRRILHCFDFLVGKNN